MAEQSPTSVPLPKIRQGIPTLYGVIVMLVVLVGVVVMFIFLSTSQDLAPTPPVVINRLGKMEVACAAGEVCSGPTVTAEDPEGDPLTYKFFDRATGEQVGKVTAPSGQAVTPEFNFDSSGEKQLYMVVEDGSGHTSKDYPIIIPVK